MRTLTLTLALVATNLWAGEVYRSYAPDGTVIYSDRPADDHSEPIFIAVETPKNPPRPSAPSATEPDATETEAAPESAADGKPAATDADQVAEERAKICEIARERAKRYSEAHRLYRTLPSGEREYLSDSEIDEARAQATADVETRCK